MCEKWQLFIISFCFIQVEVSNRNLPGIFFIKAVENDVCTDEAENCVLCLCINTKIFLWKIKFEKIKRKFTGKYFILES